MTITAHFPVKVMTTLEWGYGAVRLGGMEGFGCDVSKCRPFYQEFSWIANEKAETYGGCGLNSDG